MRARCLIVDDEAPAREELRYLLGTIEGTQVVGEAANGEEALLLLRSLDYDLVLLDIKMPGGTGLAVAEAIRGAPNAPKIIFTTAYPDFAVQAFDVDAVDYLVKPFDAERLGRAIDRALTGRAEETGPQPAQPAAGESPVRIPVQQGDRTVLVAETSILYATAARGYSY
ncbi:MAG: LytR/AlgR family response regulator transcription factor, partial [Micromonosporaceae bacterium]